MKLNFKKFKRYSSMNHSSYTVVDVREVFADLIYLELGTGIADKCLAEKIYKSTEETDFNEEEVARIRAHASKCQPWFADYLEETINFLTK